MSRRWIVGLAIACGCGAPLHARAPAADRLGAIRLEGNHAIETGALVPALALDEAIRDGAAVDPYLLTLDTERIRGAYLKRGFFAVQVTARIEPGDGHGQVVVFAIAEGRRATTAVEIAGLPPELALARARALVALRDGAPFDYEAYDAAKQPLQALVEDAGYAHAEVQPTVTGDPAAAVARVRYEIAAGERCVFGAITVAGTRRPALIEAARARLHVAPGEHYSASALAASQTEIYEVGRFSSVRVRPELGGGTTINVTVELAEANRHEIHGGFGFGYEPATYEPRARAGFSVVPAAVPLLTLAADARAGVTIPHSLDTSQAQPKLRAFLSAQYLDLFKPRLRGEVEVGADYQTVEAYTWTGEHVRVGLASPLGTRWLQLRVGWVLEHLTFDALDAALQAPPLGCQASGCETPAQRLRLDRPQLRGAYEASLVADLRDSANDPHRGVYLALPVAEGTPLAGGELTYLQVTPEARWYLSVGDAVIAARARVGAIFGDIPVTQRYYSGGATGQRGFSDRRLSPTAPGRCTPGQATLPCVVIGGAGLIETGVELRRPLGTLWAIPLGGTAFLDGGDVIETAEELDPSNLHWAIGAGVWTRIGGLGGLKIRVDVGYRLNRQSSESDAFANVAPHLGIGETF